MNACPVDTDEYLAMRSVRNLSAVPIRLEIMPTAGASVGKWHTLVERVEPRSNKYVGNPCLFVPTGSVIRTIDITTARLKTMHGAAVKDVVEGEF